MLLHIVRIILKRSVASLQTLEGLPPARTSRRQRCIAEYLLVAIDRYSRNLEVEIVHAIKASVVLPKIRPLRQAVVRPI